jgi:hypothetical protein
VLFKPFFFLPKGAAICAERTAYVKAVVRSDFDLDPSISANVLCE